MPDNTKFDDETVYKLATHIFRLIHVLRNGTCVMDLDPKMHAMADRMELVSDEASEYLKENGLSNPWKFPEKYRPK